MKIPGQNIIIADEPVWAIGTGLAASPSYADSVHSFIKEALDSATNSATQVLYGGSINTQNSRDFLQQTNIGGLLVGGASLNAQSILSIYRS